MWFRCEEQPHKLRVLEVTGGRALGQIDLGVGVDFSVTSSDVRWTAGANILHTWSAGTNAAEANLYDSHGRVLLSISTDGIDVSPSVRYLATFPAALALEPLDVRLYDLASGVEIARSPEELEIAEVEEIVWRSKGAVIRYTTVDKSHGEFVFPIDGAQ